MAPIDDTEYTGETPVSNGKSKTSFHQIRTPYTATIDGITYSIFASYEVDEDTKKQYPAKLGIKTSYNTSNKPELKLNEVTDQNGIKLNPPKYRRESDVRVHPALIPVLVDYGQSVSDHNRIQSYEKAVRL